MAQEKHAGGRPPGESKERTKFYLASLARDFTESAVALIAATMNDATQKRDVRIKAAEILLERGWGKAPIEINLGTQEEGIKFILEVREFNALCQPLTAIAAPALQIAVDELTGDNHNDLATTTARGQS